jgi:hypothetical protein
LCGGDAPELDPEQGNGTGSAWPPATRIAERESQPFVEIDELIEFIGMADITAALRTRAVTWTLLRLAVAAGTSTPYWYAEELLPMAEALVPSATQRRRARP